MNAPAPYPLDYEISIARIIGLRLDELRAEARELERALARLHASDFGACEACGACIPYLELATHPAATHCAACQKGD